MITYVNRIITLTDVYRVCATSYVQSYSIPSTVSTCCDIALIHTQVVVITCDGGSVVS